MEIKMWLAILWKRSGGVFHGDRFPSIRYSRPPIPGREQSERDLRTRRTNGMA